MYFILLEIYKIDGLCKGQVHSNSLFSRNLGKLVEKQPVEISALKSRRKHIKSTQPNMMLIFVILLYHQHNWRKIENLRTHQLRKII